MTTEEHGTDDRERDAPKSSGIPSKEEAAIDKALQAEDEADEAAAEEIVTSDEQHHNDI